jgi:hypothetical protein
MTDPNPSQGPRPRSQRWLVVWVVLVAISGGAIGTYLCWGLDSGGKFLVIYMASIVTLMVCSIPLGIVLGTQDKEYWQ